MKYHLGILSESPLVIQKKKTFARQRQPFIQENIQELLKAGIIKQVEYPKWVVNPVIVPKYNSEWQMCIDYTDLNKAIPKKPFPLPRIDQVVDAVGGHTVLYFLDSYKGCIRSK